MAINFPSTPTDGQQYTENGKTWSYSTDASAWLVVTSANLTVNTVTASGNITAAYFIGNGSALTGLTGLANTSGISFAGYLNFPTGNVGIGVSNATSKVTISENAATAAPLSGSILHVAGADSVTPRILFDSYGNTPVFSFRRAQGTAASPSAVTSDLNIVSITAFGYGSTGYSSATRATFNAFAQENWTDTAQGTGFRFLTTGVGTTTIAERMRITGNGLVGISTTTPSANLDVTGNVNITGTLTVAGSNVFAVNVQTFTTSGTWTKPTGFGANSHVFIQAWGGGGSGARGTANNGSGGGGGGYNFTWEKLSDLGATETVTIGLGGASRTTATFYQPGAAGGTSSFGTLLYAYGGGGGSNNRPSTGYTFGGSGGGQTSAGGTATTFNDSSGNPGGPLIVRSATYSGTAPTLALFYQGHGRTLQDSDAAAYVGPFEAYMHGGGGGGGGGTGQPSTRQGGTSVWGGGGGGANNSNGGISIYGGNGGNGKSTSAEATAGIEPGGGGGGSNTASGAGANGRIIVTVFAGSA